MRYRKCLSCGNKRGTILLLRIPLKEECDETKKKLKVPATYGIPAFIGIGYADPKEPILEQYVPNLDEQIHFGRWEWASKNRRARKSTFSWFVCLIASKSSRAWQEIGRGNRVIAVKSRKINGIAAASSVKIENVRVLQSFFKIFEVGSI